MTLLMLIPRLHDRANMEQTSSKRQAIIEQTSSKRQTDVEQCIV